MVFLQVIASGVIHALWNFAAKRSSGNIAVNWLAQIVGALALLPFALIEKGFSSLGPLGLKCILASAVVQAFYFFMLSTAYRKGEISVVYPISRGLGIGGAAVVGVLLFGEIVNLPGGLGIAAIAGGTFAIGYGQLRQRGADLMPVFLAVVLAITLTTSSFIDNTAVSNTPPIAYLCLVYVASSIVSAPFFLMRYRTGITQALTSQKKLLTIVGTGAAFGYLIILFALKNGPLGYILAVREIAVVGGAILGFAFLGEKIYLAKIVGIAAIVTGIVLIKVS